MNMRSIRKRKQQQIYHWHTNDIRCDGVPFFAKFSRCDGYQVGCGNCDNRMFFDLHGRFPYNYEEMQDCFYAELMRNEKQPTNDWATAHRRAKEMPLSKQEVEDWWNAYYEKHFNH